ncbi:MAG: toll/interleukin-1 receptor domain-containing protein [Saprospiraceae bacterium]|nr:toll/interleukin-1 receptor domain-containing protein [Saprospiraceae bacterium]
MQIDQEDLYRLLYEQKWDEIIQVLYENKDLIKSDALLERASSVFEEQFTKNIDNLVLPKDTVLEILEKLFLLHNGKFYVLDKDNYKTIVLSIIKRKSLSEAFNYANEFPYEPICREIISNYNIQKIKQEGYKLNSPHDYSENWVEIYNRLFELINDPDQAIYFSGPRFIKVVQETIKYFPDYAQFIEQRNNQGKSTSRKVFFYDILLGIETDERNKILTRLLEILKPFKEDEVTTIESLIQGKKITKIKKENFLIEDKPNIFISYSWDSEEHKEWVLKVANDLCNQGINVILDRYYLNSGKSITKFVENHIESVNKVVIIFTKNYKSKADKRQGGVGHEYSILNQELYDNQADSERIIPVLREGKPKESIPAYMRQLIRLDITNDSNYDNWFADLVREIYDEPVIRKPEIGKRTIK